jgi:aspartate kinase
MRRLTLIDSLLKASREAAKPDSTKCDAIVSQILHEHIDAMHFQSPGLSQRLERDMTTECQKLNKILAAMPKNGEVSRESEDEIVSVGEKLSAQFLSTLLEDYGVDSEYVDLSDVIDFEVLRGLNQDFYQDLAQAIGRRIQLCGEKVPVITGFFGRVPGGLLTNCGRGYSDLCAALVAVGLGAQELQVWKEVSGVYTAYGTLLLSSAFHSAKAV